MRHLTELRVRLIHSAPKLTSEQVPLCRVEAARAKPPAQEQMIFNTLKEIHFPKRFEVSVNWEADLSLVQGAPFQVITLHSSDV